MENVKFIMRTTGERDLSGYEENIPNLIIAKDRIRNAYDTFQYALELSGDNACVHLEDDIILCSDFYKRIKKIISSNSDKVIQFFSMRSADLTIGTRIEKGRTFIGALCFYVPKNMSKLILEYSKTWRRISEHPTGLDLMVADYLKDNKVDYIIICPNLVDHKVGQSLINKKRTSPRTSKTFVM